MKIEKINELFARFAGQLLRMRWMTLAIFTLVLVLSVIGMKRMVKETSFDDYFIEDDPMLVMTDEFKSHFGNDYYVGVYPLTLGQYRNIARWDGDSGNFGTVQAAGGASAPAIAVEYTTDLSAYGRARPLVWAASLRWYIRDAEAASDTAGTWPRDGHRIIASTRFLAKLRGTSPDDFAELTFANAERFFR